MNGFDTADVDTIRIDTFRGEDDGALYMFVHPENEKWDAWWAFLFESLGEFGPGKAWRIDNESHEIMRVVLSPERTEDLLTLLQTAPETERQEHRSLKLTIKRLETSDYRVAIVFFMKSP